MADKPDEAQRNTREDGAAEEDLEVKDLDAEKIAGGLYTQNPCKGQWGCKAEP